jgi:hypothetical protein
MPTMVAESGLAAKVAHGIPLTAKDIVPGNKGHQRQYVKVVNRRNHLLAVVQGKKDSKNYDYCCVFQA